VVEKQTVFAMTFGKMKGHRWMLKVIKNHVQEKSCPDKNTLAKHQGFCLEGFFISLTIGL